MTSAVVRPATAADQPAIVAGNLAMALETEHKQLDEATVTAGVAALLADPARGVYYVAEEDGRLIGQLALTWEWSDWRNGTFWWIQSVYVAPDRRGAGIFKTLYRYVLAEARRRDGVCGVRLYVDKANDNAMTVYRRLGMEITHYDLLEVDFTLE
ncbi:MAG TPA: GNAT family N-acetyltransferase [Gammaproteobacteria bacterium]|nr:GNAT family N-acetyltransferase [Gammaproteobacteria bacterium]